MAAAHRDEAKLIADLRAAIGPQTGHAAAFCTDDCLSRYLRARSWSLKKAEAMLRNTLKWRLEYQPWKIRWEDVATESETGKVYRLPVTDRQGRPVVCMRPAAQNSFDHDLNIKHLVYCLENAVFTAASLGGEQIVWLIDYDRYTLRNAPPLKTSRMTLDILQNHYPERLGAAYLFKPPWLFETFWKVIRPLIDPVTKKKVHFIHEKSQRSQDEMAEAFDMEKMETAFGGASAEGYNHEAYSQKMVADDEQIAKYWAERELEVLGGNVKGLTLKAGDVKDPGNGNEGQEDGEVDHYVNHQTTPAASDEVGGVGGVQA